MGDYFIFFHSFLSPAPASALAQLLVLLHCHLTAVHASHGGWHPQKALSGTSFSKEPSSLCPVFGMQCSSIQPVLRSGVWYPPRSFPPVPNGELLCTGENRKRKTKTEPCTRCSELVNLGFSDSGGYQPDCTCCLFLRPGRASLPVTVVHNMCHCPSYLWL